MGRLTREITMNTKDLSGSVKVAILIQSLAAEKRQEVLDRLSDSEREVIKGHLSQMGTISPDLVEKVSEEFTLLAANKTARRLNSPSGVEDKVELQDNADESPSEPASLKALKTIEPDELLELIKDEHPQTIAIILVHLAPDIASKVLSNLSDEKKIDVVFRIAGLDKVISEMVDELDNIFESVLKDKASSGTHKTGGVGGLAEILNFTDATTVQQILEEITENNPELGANIKQMMFVFDDLVLVNDRDLQKVLRNVETQHLSLALKAASDDVKEKIFRNMSERACEILKEEIETMGPVRMTEIEEAQQLITKIIQDMEEKGELVISGRGGEKLIT